MATTTPNFGWDIPQSTDLVKDGATAIAALGNDIDAAMVDLKGGTTGQILAKASNADLDFSWITNDVGDITEVIAGTGLSGGGTSGAVTLTNAMADAITAKGDLLAGTAADTFTALNVGTNGQLLTADSTAATGLAWTTISAGAYTQLATGSMSGVSTITISSINQGYRHLHLVLTGFKGASNTDLQARINGVTTNSYGDLSASNNQTYGSSYWQMGATVGTDSTNHCNFFFPNYATSSIYKYVNFNAIFKSNTNIQSYGQWIAGSSITDAISSISFFTGSINWNAGTYTLWGVK